MRKILLASIIICTLILPSVGQALTILEKCTLKHDLGERICDTYDISIPGDRKYRLQKNCEVKIERETGETPTAYPLEISGCERYCPTGPSGSTPVSKIVCKDAGVICLIDFINTIGDWIFAGLLAIVVIILFFAGFQFITAGGSPEGVMAARSKIIYAIVGLAVAFLAKALIKVVEVLVG